MTKFYINFQIIYKFILFIIISAVFVYFSYPVFTASTNILKIGTTELTIFFDPYKYNKSSILSLNQHIFESLISLDKNGKILPLLAENWVNLDDKTWIFNLRKNIFFSNGDPLTADDIIFSFERVKLDLNSTEPSNFGINLSFSKIEKINNYSVKIVTDRIFPTFLLRVRNCAILPKNYIEKNGIDYFLENPVGTGPYMRAEIKKLENGKILRLVRNERYWGKKPYFKEVEFYILPEQKLNEMIQKSELDCFIWVEPYFFSNFKESANYKKLSTPGLRTNFLILNCENKQNQNISLPFNPLVNEFVRKAIYYAINLDEIINKIFSGTASKANQLVSPAVIGFNPKISSQTQNLLLAKQYMQKANLQNSFDILLHYSEKDETFEKIANLLKVQLKLINIDLRLQKLKDSELAKIRREGNFAITPYSLSSGTGDALFVVSTLLHSKSDSWGTYNFSGFKDSEIDNLIEKVSEEFEEQKRIELYQRIMMLTMDKLPFIPLYWPNVLAIVKSKLKWQIRADERVYAFEMSY